jgi:uncharacterized protein (UPF0276 family)
VWDDVPFLGVGQRWDGPFDSARLRFLGHGIDFVEPSLPIDVEPLTRLIGAAPIVTHSSELALASTGPLNEAMVTCLAGQVRAVEPPWTGEHFTLVSPIETGDLGYNFAPPLDDETIDAAIQKVRSLVARYGCPLALEAGPRYFPFRGWDDHGAIARIAAATGCGVILDVSHHVASALNLGVDVMAGLSDEVLASVVEVHVTGLGRHRDGRHYYDHHGGPVPPVCWELLHRVLPDLVSLKGVVLEHSAAVTDEEYRADLAKLNDLVDSLAP